MASPPLLQRRCLFVRIGQERKDSMRHLLLPFSSVLLGTVLVIGASTSATAVEVIQLRSGIGSLNQPDPVITYLGTGSCCSEFPAFTAAHFASAASGPAAIIIGQAHSNWMTTLPCNSSTRWVGTAVGGTPQTALFAHGFQVQTACVFTATLEFCWLTDDRLGGVAANPQGVYLNGSPVAGIFGGSYSAQSSVGPVNVTALVVPGQNYLYTYEVDNGAVVSGVNYRALLRINECPVPAIPTSWSGIKIRNS
jgi:hypothetical protein